VEQRVTKDTLKRDAGYCNKEKTGGKRMKDGLNSGAFRGKLG
jgi:hypothetical protein